MTRWSKLILLLIVLFATFQNRTAYAQDISLARKIPLSENPLLSGILAPIGWNTKKFQLIFPKLTPSNAPQKCHQLPKEHKTVIKAVFRELATFSNLLVTQKLSSSKLFFCGWNENYSLLGRVNAKFPHPCSRMSCKPITGQSWLSKKHQNLLQRTNMSYLQRWWRHEIGHILGLEHPHDIGILPARYDMIEYTLMSYRWKWGKQFGALGWHHKDYPSSYMPIDILALQYLYGTNRHYHDEDTHYQWKPGHKSYWINGKKIMGSHTGKFLMTLWDGGGTDTIDLGLYNEPVSIDLRPGHFSRLPPKQTVEFNDGNTALGSIALSFLLDNDRSGLIENAVAGRGNDMIYANEANNRLKGGKGRDQFVFSPGTRHDLIVDYEQGEIINLCAYKILTDQVKKRFVNNRDMVEISMQRFPLDRIFVKGHQLDSLKDVVIRTQCPLLLPNNKKMEGYWYNKKILQLVLALLSLQLFAYGTYMFLSRYKKRKTDNRNDQ